MGLTMATPKKYNLTMGTNTGMQGSTYNPQRTVTTQYVQPAAPIRYVQPAAPIRYVQNAASIRYVQNAAAIAAANRVYQAQQVARARQAQIVAAQRAEAARQEAIRREAERQLQIKKAAARQELSVKKAKNHQERFAEFQMLNRKMLAKMSLADQVKYYFKLNAEAQGADRETNKTLFDQISGRFGSQVEARKWAQSQQGKLQGDVKQYEKDADVTYKKIAKYEQAIADAIAKKDQATYDRLVAEANKYLGDAKKKFEFEEARISGSSEGYGKFSNKQLGGWLAGVGKFFDPKKNPVSAGMTKLFEHTLGSGNANIPSVITAPSRIVNTLGNMTRKKGDMIVQKDGSKVSYDGNPWTASFGQSNLNSEYKAPKFSDWSINRFKAMQKPGTPWDNKKYQAWVSYNAKELSRKYNEETQRQGAGVRTAQDWALDPFSYMPGAAGSKIVGLPSKAATALKATSVAQKLGTTKFGKAAKWLGAEKQTVAEKYRVAEEAYRKRQTAVQEAYFKRFNQAQKVIRQDQVNYSYFDDLKGLSDSDAKILQRMRGEGTFDPRDAAKLLLDKNRKARLLSIHGKAQSNAKVYKLADNVQNTRFDGKYYSKSWLSTPKDKNTYDFRKFRKNDNILDAENFGRAQMERYMMSKADDVGSAGGERVIRAQKELRKLQEEYQVAKLAGRDEMERLYKKMNGKGKYFHKALGIPMNVWKTSVLALRPAWYLNNSVYNTAAGVLAAGPSSLVESAKLLKPGALTAARKANPKVIGQLEGANPSRQNPLWRIAGAIEDNGRLGTNAALRKQGYSKEESLRRVNRTFFNYKPKNWERPLKTVMPFWGWTKGTARLSAEMPFTNSRAAIGLNRNEENNQRQTNMLPEDRRWIGQGKQYIGKNKDGDPQFMNSPWNPFNSGTFDKVGLNPFMAALGEISRQKDFYGNPLDDKSILGVFADKFAQPALARKAFEAWKQSRGDIDTAVRYFSEANSEGIKTTKWRQGNDASKGNYSKKLDKRNIGDDVAAFLGMPKITSFDSKKYDRENRMTKLNKDFFKHDWKKEFTNDKGELDYDGMQNAQKALAKKYGFDLQKDLYDGYWSKNDTPLTASLKKQRGDASKAAKEFWNEYHKQGYGNKSIWAKNKMLELTKQGVFAKNPFLRGMLPDWHSPASVAKAETAEFWKHYFSLDKDGRRALMGKNPQFNKYKYSYKPSQKKIDYLAAKASGDWSTFNARYGNKYGFKVRGTSAKRADYLAAKSSGNWTAYNKKYGYSSAAQAKFAARRAEWDARDTKRREAAAFWTKFFKAENAERKRLMAENPQYNKFAGQEPKTQEEWDKIMEQVKAGRMQRLTSDAAGSQFFQARKADVARDFVRNSRVLEKRNKVIRWK